MSNNLNKTDLANTMFRPKRLYLTSEDVKDFDDSGSCRFTLKESIIAEEGFRLAYGLKSFGYNATANSISRRLKNNKLYFEITYQEPAFIYTTQWIANPRANEQLTQPMELIVPDGFYPTLDSLFEALNDTSLNLIPSGVKVDVLNTSSRSNQILLHSNNVPLLLTWKETAYGYSVAVALQTLDSEPIKNDYTNTSVNPHTHLQAYQVNYRPIQLKLLPHDDDHEGLYNLLFFNECAAVDTPANMPSSAPYTGQNPPSNVTLFMATTLSYDSNATGNPVDFVDVSEGFTYQWGFNGSDDPLLNTYLSPYLPRPNSIFNCQTYGYKNLPLHILYKPRLYPIYIEVDTSLETQNLTVDGYATNLFFRHFPLGADLGAKSFFQDWDQPVIHHMQSARNHIDSIKIDIISESDKWDFFNMTFFLEIVFYEILDEEELPTFQDTPFEIPSEDAMTTSLQQYSNNFHNPFPVKTTPGERGTLHLGSTRNGELKRRRR